MTESYPAAVSWDLSIEFSRFQTLKCNWKKTATSFGPFHLGLIKILQGQLQFEFWVKQTKHADIKATCLYPTLDLRRSHRACHLRHSLKCSWQGQRWDASRRASETKNYRDFCVCMCVCVCVCVCVCAHRLTDLTGLTSVPNSRQDHTSQAEG